MTVSIKKLLEDSRNISSVDARILLQHASGMSREQVAFNQDFLVAPEVEKKFREFIERRKNHEPVAYIIGQKEFYSRDFSVTPAVLIPRPESELFIDYAAQFFPNKNSNLRILELGVGSGAVLITLLMEYPNATGLGVDISSPALEIAETNSAQYILLDSRIKLLESNWFSDVSGKFDLIISNPPYVAYEDEQGLQPDLAHEPRGALFAEKEGLACYEEIAHNLGNALAVDGIALFEIGHGKLEAIKEIFTKYEFEFVGYLQDLSGIPRCVAFRHK